MKLYEADEAAAGKGVKILTTAEVDLLQSALGLMLACGHNATPIELLRTKLAGPLPPDAEVFAQREAELRLTKWLLRQMLEALPTRRDWLDPVVEREARSLAYKPVGLVPAPKVHSTSVNLTQVLDDMRTVAWSSSKHKDRARCANCGRDMRMDRPCICEGGIS
jgi:hypothetical protein